MRANASAYGKAKGTNVSQLRLALLLLMVVDDPPGLVENGYATVRATLLYYSKSVCVKRPLWLSVRTYSSACAVEPLSYWMRMGNSHEYIKAFVAPDDLQASQCVQIVWHRMGTAVRN